MPRGSIRLVPRLRPQPSRYVQPYAAHVIAPRDGAHVALVCGAAVTIVGSLCPWVASGRVDRSSYEIIDLVDSLGFAEDGSVELALRAWPLMPLLVVAGTCATWWRREVVGPVLTAAGAIYAMAVAVTVRRASSNGLTRIRFGPTLTLAGAALLLAGTIVAAAIAVSARRVR